MAKIRRVDFSPDEWIAGTRELTLEERGAYWDVCSLQYSRGGPIADDDVWISRALGCHVRTWRAIKVRLLALEKLVLADGHLINARAEKELKRAEKRLKQARDAAQESVKARQDRVENAAHSNDYNEIPEAAATDFDRAIQQPTTSNQQISPPATSSITEDVENLTEERITAPSGDGAGERGGPEAGPEASSRKARAEARGTRLPDGWQPSPEAVQFARDLNLNPDSVTAEFVDYWRGVPGQRGRKIDWDATYRNRCRDIAARRPHGQRTRERQGSGLDGESTTLAGVSAAFARRSFSNGG